MLRHRRFLTAIAILGWLTLSAFAQECSKDKPCATGCCTVSVERRRSTAAKDALQAATSGWIVMLKILARLGAARSSGSVASAQSFALTISASPAVTGRENVTPVGVLVGRKDRPVRLMSAALTLLGFCGTTKEFCGNTTVRHPTCAKDGYMTRVVGYYEGWSSRRPCNKFWPEQIPVGVYSHINFAFATIDPETYEVGPADKQDVDLYKRLVAIKEYDKDVKILIALGGWTFNDPGPTATVFSDLAASEEKQKKFFKSLVSFMSTYGFDGVDLDWEYPRADDRSGRPEDFKNFPKFMANLKKTLNQTPGRSELSITLPASYWYLQHFNLKDLNKHIDFYNIMSYDMHGTWDRGNKWTGSFLNAHTNITEIRDSLDLLWRNDVDPARVVLGVAFYGRAYTVKGCMEPGCEYASGSIPGACSREVGVLLNNEIVDIIREKDLEPVLYKDAAVKVVHWDDQWVSYDDRETLRMKAELARSQCLSGLMVWAISHDVPTADFSYDLAAIANRKVWLRRVEQEDDGIIKEIENNYQCFWSDEWGNRHTKHHLSLRKYCCDTRSDELKFENCEWFNGTYEGTDGLSYVVTYPGQQCVPYCPNGKKRVALNSYNWGCYNDGASVFCCDAIAYSTKERLSDELQAFSDAMDSWLSTPGCVEEATIDGEQSP
ncbi:glycoside hydrolase superfamily [Aspergillus granulosus]|uniref:chitinase n=1 Tax=Aspergillus granulosus TaxID=176169 RepID=A0ABR4H6K4_9EURO